MFSRNYAQLLRDEGGGGGRKSGRGHSFTALHNGNRRTVLFRTRMRFKMANTDMPLSAHSAAQQTQQLATWHPFDGGARIPWYIYILVVLRYSCFVLHSEGNTVLWGCCWAGL